MAQYVIGILWNDLKAMRNITGIMERITATGIDLNEK